MQSKSPSQTKSRGIQAPFEQVASSISQGPPGVGGLMVGPTERAEAIEHRVNARTIDITTRNRCRSYEQVNHRQ